MDEDSLKELWLASGDTQKVEINAEELMKSIHRKLSSMEKSVRKRNRREVFVAVLMIPFFGWWAISDPHVLAKIGASVIFFNCFLVIFKLTHYRKMNTYEDTGAATKIFLMGSLLRVRREMKLLNTLLWWYLLPLFVGTICLFYSFPITIIYKIVYTAAVVLLYSYIYYMNKQVVRKKLKPLEAGIVHALDELETNNIL